MIASKLRLFAPAGNFAASKNGEGLIAADILENLPLALKKSEIYKVWRWYND